ncbi:MAG TPA: RNA-binding S4 domain-containing protein [Vicingaceae bacterium]|jgi:ribosome-associated protein|nr:RNA-binding S4 domain-containing protein [Vicingaceae bacterium]
METITFELKGDYIELIKLLKFTGVCDTGGEAKQCVEDGLVKLHQNIETQKRKKIRKGDLIYFQNVEIKII